MSKPGRPAKWRRCPQCNTRGLIGDDFYTWNDNGARRISRLCKECCRQRVRDRYKRIMADPYLAERERTRKTDWATKQARNPERCRRYRAKLKAERPDVYQQQLEDARIRNRQRADKRGAPTATKRTPVTEAPARRVPVDPLVDFLERHGDEDRMDPADVRTVYRIVHEGAARVSVPVADRLITTLGGSLAAVYPDLYA